MPFKTDYIILFILNIFDILTTITFLELNLATEGNPLMLYILDTTGYFGLLASKIIFLGFLGFVLSKESSREEIRNSKIAKYGIRFLVLAYIFVVILNFSIIVPYFIQWGEAWRHYYSY